MKWSRVYYTEWGNEPRTEEGSCADSLLKDLTERDAPKGELEQLQNQVDVLQSVLAGVLERMTPGEVSKIIEEHHSDYMIT